VFQVAGFEQYDFQQRGVTEQFLGNADVYVEKFTNPAHFRDLYARALKVTHLTSSCAPLRVFDIGTGGGNSVFAIRELLPNTTIVGVDISRPLLEFCSLMAEQRYHVPSGAMALLCADLFSVDVVPHSADLVTGSSILHHMLEPEAIVAQALTALKPGGYAIFTEPFEIGHGILRGIYSLILELDQSKREPLPNTLKTWLSAYVKDFDARRGVGNIREYTRRLDDKWFFTDSWFRSMGKQHHCDVTIMPSHGSGTVFWNQFVYSARMFNGSDANELPMWAKAVFNKFDETFSAQQLAEIPFGGIVVMHKMN